MMYLKSAFLHTLSFSLLTGSFFFLPSALSSEHLSNIKAGYQDGFYLASEDERYKLKIGGRLNFMFSQNYFAQNTNTQGFDLIHGKLYLGGHLHSKNIEYFLQTAFGQYQDNNLRFIYPSESELGQFRLEDYYVRMLWGKTYVQLGQFKVPFSRQAMIYSGNLNTPFRNHVTQAFSLRRDKGVMLSRYSKTLHASAGVFNGNGPISIDNGSPLNPNISNGSNSGLMYATRLGYAPKGYAGYSEGDVEDSQTTRFEINGSLAYHKKNDILVDSDTEPDISLANVLSYNTDVIWKKRGWALQAEYYKRYIKSNVQNDIESWGYYIQPSIFITPSQLQLVGSYAFSNLNDAIKDSSHEISSGINIYFSKDHRQKLQGLYSYRHYQLNTQKLKDQTIQISMQFSL